MSLCVSYSSYENAFVQISLKKNYFVVKSPIMPIKIARFNSERMQFTISLRPLK